MENNLVIADLERQIRERDAIIIRLTEQDAALKRLMDSNIIGIGITTTEGEITLANDYYLRVLGVVDVAGPLRWDEMTPDEWLPLDRRAITEAYQKGFCTPYEKEYRRPDGSLVPVLVAFALFGGNKAIAYVKDITKQKGLEHELRKRIEALMDADIRKNEFVAMLAHELRNPLAPILNSVPVMRRLSNGADPRIGGIIDMVERQVGALSRLIEDLLDVSRITNSQITLRTEIVNLWVVLRNAAEPVRTLVSQKGHELAFDLPEEKVIMAGDRVRLEQIFTNLIQNAAKYTDPNGRILVSASIDGDHVIVVVKDSGIGIDPNIQDRIWELFGQGQQSLERSQGGLGLGLTIVKKLIEMHGGGVTVKSEGAGCGSEFIVRLPKIGAKMATTTGGDTGNTPPTSQKALDILVVDDNVDATHSLALFLELCGHRPDVVFDGNRAVEAATDKAYDVILLDIGLPGMTGYEVCKTLRDNGNTAYIIAITGYGQDDDKQKSKQAGFNRHLVKPVNPDLVEECLAAIGK